jgi:hypothetical protein
VKVKRVLVTCPVATHGYSKVDRFDVPNDSDHELDTSVTEGVLRISLKPSGSSLCLVVSKLLRLYAAGHWASYSVSVQEREAPTD